MTAKIVIVSLTVRHNEREDDCVLMCTDIQFQVLKYSIQPLNYKYYISSLSQQFDSTTYYGPGYMYPR